MVEEEEEMMEQVISRLLLLLVLLVLTIGRLESYVVSTHDLKEWTKGTPYECHELKLCTPSNMTWRYQNPNGFYNNTGACDVLLSKFLRKSQPDDVIGISIMGDSFMRHFTTALAMTLVNHYNGFVYRPTGDAAADKEALESIKQNNCYDGNEQYAEKSCSFLGINHLPLDYCGKRVTISYSSGGIDSDKVSFISYGNGVVNAYNTSSINNATLNMWLLEHRGICAKNKIFKRPAFILSTHYRIAEYKGRGRQNHEDVEQYNNEMRHFIENEGRCGNAIFVDVYNMTKGLVMKHFNDSLSMSFDHMHYTRNVNLLKVQIALAHVMKLPSSH